MAISVERGDIVIVDLGDENHIVGREQANKRPCIVINSFDAYKLVLIVPFSKENKATAYYTIVKVDAGTGGLALDSYALCHQIRTVSIDRVKHKIGVLPIEDFNKIITVITDMIDL